LQKSAESAQAAATEAEEEGQLSSQPQQQPAAMPVHASPAEAASLQEEEVVEQPSQQPQQQQAKSQAAAVPAAKLTKAQRQRWTVLHVCDCHHLVMMGLSFSYAIWSLAASSFDWLLPYWSTYKQFHLSVWEKLQNNAAELCLHSSARTSKL